MGPKLLHSWLMKSWHLILQGYGIHHCVSIHQDTDKKAAL